MSEFIDPTKLEEQFAEALAPVEHGNRLLMTGINLETGVVETDGFVVTDAATPNEKKTVLLCEHTETGAQYKITLEELSNGE